MAANRTLSISFIIVLLQTGFVGAWLRPSHDDATVVERSELIVVGHLDAASIQFVLHKNKPHEGRNHEHHATLVIHEVLKGSEKKKSMPITIHYGLTPRVGGIDISHGFDPVHNSLPQNDPNAVINILDTGNSVLSCRPLVKDAGKDNLWFLRKRSGIYGRKPGTGNYGIVDPEDLQPLELKDYFLAFLATNPEAAVKTYMKDHPAVTKRAQRYLDHLEIQRICRIKIPSLRCEKLLPFYMSRCAYNTTQEARQGIVSCGTVAGEKLEPVFRDPKHYLVRGDIIRIWIDIGYKQAIPILIDLLKQHDTFWENQELKTGWWNSDVGTKQTRRRREIYGETYYAVCALRSFGDPKARPVIEMTKKRWQTIPVNNTQIPEKCDEALKVFDKQ
ncbi:MAG: hypothetical protein JXA11_08860 [Phycisphaerae bacterium]|nr:hypothetical protein [Phycisphaerae bacterium]